MELFLKIVKVFFGLVGGLISGVFGLLAGGGEGHEGPRAALPPDQLPQAYRGFWKGIATDDSPNTYSGYGVTLDFVNWRSTTEPTGPGHRGSSGRLRLVAVHGDSIEVEEDVTVGASIEYSVDGVYTLTPNGSGQLRLQWRSQYPSRDIYVGHGRLSRVESLPKR